MGERFNSLMWSLLLHVTDFVETGAGQGTTAGAVADRFDRPVWTCETDPANVERLVLARLNERVNLYQLTSPVFLDLIWNRLGNQPLFYLDAHGPDSYPLLDELALVSGKQGAAVIIVHDFKVPDRTWAEFAYCQLEGCDNDFEYVLPALHPANRYRFYLPAYRPPAGERYTGYVLIFQNVAPIGELGALTEWHA